MGSNAALIGVDYAAPHPDTFNGFTVDIDGTVERFGSLSDAVEFAESHAVEVLYLSSVDDFKVDVERQIGATAYPTVVEGNALMQRFVRH